MGKVHFSLAFFFSLDFSNGFSFGLSDVAFFWWGFPYCNNVSTSLHLHTELLLNYLYLLLHFLWMLVCMHTVCMNIYGLCTTWIKFCLHIFMFDCFICNIFIRPLHVFILNFNSFIFLCKTFYKISNSCCEVRHIFFRATLTAVQNVLNVCVKHCEALILARSQCSVMFFFFIGWTYLPYKYENG